MVIEYVSADLDAGDPSLAAQFAGIFEKFMSAEALTGAGGAGGGDQAAEGGAAARDEAAGGAPDADAAAGADGGAVKPSKRQIRKKGRLTVAELKKLVPRPEIVEVHDTTAADPRLLVHLKAMRNTVAVPRHWSHKRKYLQGKRGIEKPAFLLPEFIADTGIAKLRSAVQEIDDKKKGKAKQRERVKPKMGKIDIDYQILHDAFFKFQTKPKMTRHGDLYYEGREFEVKSRDFTPGALSAELKAALGMAPGTPPPWLISMQRYGPPPSYPGMRIPGLSAPIPAGAQYGYHPGGWGRPPVNELGMPLYGDVFGRQGGGGGEEAEGPVDRSHWGEVAEAESVASEGGGEGGGEDPDAAGGAGAEDGAAEAGGEGGSGSGADRSGIETPMTDGYASTVPSGMETPASVELRKQSSGMETPDVPALYQVLQTRDTSVGGSLFGSSAVYVVPGAKGGGGGGAGASSKPGGPSVSVNIAPDLLDSMDETAIKAAYARQLKAEEAQREGDDGMADLIAEEQAKRKRMAAAAAAGGAKKSKTDFKF